MRYPLSSIVRASDRACPLTPSLAEVLREIGENALPLAGLHGHAVGDHAIDDDGPFVARLSLLSDHLETVADDASPGHHLLVTVSGQRVRVLRRHARGADARAHASRPAPSPTQRDSDHER